VLLIVRLRSLSSRRLTILLVFAALSVILVTPFTTNRNQDPSDIHSFDAYESLRPVLAPLGKESPDPIRWLQENSNDKYAVSRSILPPLPAFGSSRRPRAALISLVRNSELAGMVQSMRQLELRWNRKYQVSRFFVAELQFLTCNSTLGSFSMTNLSPRNSREELRAQLQSSAITRLFQESIGPY
jgi:hypothetical protein